MSKNNKLEKLDVVAAFVHELMIVKGADSPLHICTSNFSVFSLKFSNAKRVSGFDWRSEIEEGKKYDFILGEFPLGMAKREECQIGSEKLKIRQNWVEIVKSVNLLHNNGMALYLVEPIAFGAARITRDFQ